MGTMGTLIDGQAIARKIETEIKKLVDALLKRGITPALAVVLVGEDKASQSYVRLKQKKAQEVGLNFAVHALPASTTNAELKEKLLKIQADRALHGLIVQLPLPAHIDTADILNAIRPEIDIDCLTYVNLGKLVLNKATILPPTAGAIISILDELQVPLAGKNATIIGVGALVGKPLAIMLMNARASVTTCNSATRDTKEKCLAADIIVTGVGKPNILRGDMVSPGAIVIDTGVSFSNGKIFGDVNVEEVITKAAYLTPTPGGVGPITVARLLLNVVLCAEEITISQKV